MQRVLPTRTIAGYTFTVNVDEDELIFQNNNTAGIPLALLNDKGTHYIMHLDKTSNQLATKETALEDIVELSIPPLKELDPEGMCIKYGIDENALSQLRDFDIIVNPKILAERKSGKLPKVAIAGIEYCVDVIARELCCLSDERKKISLTDPWVQIDHQTGAYEFLVDTEEKIIAGYPPEEAIAGRVVLAELPFDLSLDIYGVLHRSPDIYNVSYLYRRYPPRLHHTATTTPFNELTEEKKISFITGGR